MFFCSNLKCSKVKQAALLSCLLLQAVAVQALAGEVAETAEDSTESTAVASGEEAQRRYSFPRWPERKQVVREVIPPAPPGPYMSSALSRFSTTGTAFSRGADKPVARMRSSEMPMQAFSPDLAWPSQLASPQHWIPENGYQFVDPAVRPAAGYLPRRPVYNPQNRGSRNSNAVRSYDRRYAGRDATMVNPANQSRRPEYRVPPVPAARP